MVAGQEILVNDYVRVFETRCSLDAAAGLCYVDCDLMRLRKPVRLTEDIKPAFIECLSEVFRICDDLRGVILAKLNHLGKRDPKSCEMVEVVI